MSTDVLSEGMNLQMKDYLKTRAAEELESIPFGIYSGLKRGATGIFFYYKYGEDFHFWYL